MFTNCVGTKTIKDGASVSAKFLITARMLRRADLLKWRNISDKPVHTIPDSFAPVQKPYKIGLLFTHMHERLWWRDFCDGVKRHISHSLCARVQCEQVL